MLIILVLAAIAWGIVAALAILAGIIVIYLIVLLVKWILKQRKIQDGARPSSSAGSLAQSSSQALSDYLQNQRWHADKARKDWGTETEIGICKNALDAIKSSGVSKEEKEELSVYWKQRLNYLHYYLIDGNSSSVSSRKSTKASSKHNKKSPSSHAKLPSKSDIESLVIDEEYLDGIDFSDYDDWKQDVLDYVAAVHLLSKFKNRYSALQSATFVANKIILDYLASDGSEDFFSFVKEECAKMSFSTPSEKLLYNLNGEIATMLDDGEELPDIKKRIQRRLSSTEKGSRPSPEIIYPIIKSGNSQIDSFARIAKALAHIRLKHLNISDEDIDKSLELAAKQYKPREWKTFEDYFSHAFQFGYLTERRFQRLYFILYNIAQAKQEGLSDSDIIKQVSQLYVVDSPHEKNRSEGDNTSQQLQREYESDEALPFYSFTKEEHSIIAVAARVTRELYHNKLFRKTAPVVIALINRYHKIPRNEAMPEKRFLSVSLTFLKNENKNMSSVYDTIQEIVRCIFSGLTETQTYAVIRQEFLQTIIDAKRSPKKKIGKSIEFCSDLAIKDLKESIEASGLPYGKQSLYLIVDELDRHLTEANYNTKGEYYYALLSLLDKPEWRTRFDKKQKQVMRYILQCKINSVPNVSFRALVGSRFPELYRKNEPAASKKS